jgi:hypothetical protein
MRNFLLAVMTIAVAIAATLVPLHRATWDTVIFCVLAVIGVLLVRLKMDYIIPEWASVLMLILAGVGHFIAFWWTGRVYAGNPDRSHLSTFGIAYLVVGFYLWATGRLRYRRR